MKRYQVMAKVTAHIVVSRRAESAEEAKDKAGGGEMRPTAKPRVWAARKAELRDAIIALCAMPRDAATALVDRIGARIHNNRSMRMVRGKRCRRPVGWLAASVSRQRRRLAKPRYALAVVKAALTPIHARREPSAAAAQRKAHEWFSMWL